MPSTAYFRLQAKVCLRLSLIASDEEVSSRLIVMAQECNAKAEALETDTRSPLASVSQDASSVRQRDET